jgi:mono/diheme cytochrome c family protein
MRKLTPILAGALLVLLAGCSSEPLSAEASGSEVYAANCSGCHRSDLSGGAGPALGLGSAAAEQPRDSFLTVITNGRSGMPAFGDRLTADQIAALADFLLEQQGN